MKRLYTFSLPLAVFSIIVETKPSGTASSFSLCDLSSQTPSPGNMRVRRSDPTKGSRDFVERDKSAKLELGPRRMNRA